MGWGEWERSRKARRNLGPANDNHTGFERTGSDHPNFLSKYYSPVRRQKIPELRPATPQPRAGEVVTLWQPNP